MALNPIAYTEHVVRSFLRYQLTAYPFAADPHLHAQMRGLLSLDETRRSPLLKGPYVSLSRPFRQGAAVDTLIRTWLRNRGYEVIEITANELDDEDAMARHFRRLAGYLSMPDVRSRMREDRSWFRQAAARARPGRPRLRLVTPAADARYVSCVPLVPLDAAAGAFGDPQVVPDESAREWVEVETARSPRPGMFVARVVGRSMEPRIPDGAYCLFAGPVTGTRQGRIVLVQLRDEVDPDTGERFTVKRYRSERTTDEGGWRHVRIMLEPINPDFGPIVLTADEEDSVTVVAELIEVIESADPE